MRTLYLLDVAVANVESLVNSIRRVLKSHGQQIQQQRKLTEELAFEIKQTQLAVLTLGHETKELATDERQVALRQLLNFYLDI